MRYGRAGRRRKRKQKESEGMVQVCMAIMYISYRGINVLEYISCEMLEVIKYKYLVQRIRS